MARIFSRANGEEFDYVINTYSGIRLSDPEEIYRLRFHEPTMALAKEAERRGVKAYVDMSTAKIYQESNKPVKEGEKEKPRFAIARQKLATEGALCSLDRLNLVILRTAQLYGNYLQYDVFPVAICMGRVYKELGKPMPFLFSQDQPMATLSVVDAVRAIWTAAEWRARAGPRKPTDPIVFNLVDHNHTTKRDIATALSNLFGIEHTFVGTLMTQFAKMHVDDVVDETNEETLEVWASLLAKNNITRPGPISPFLEREMLNDGDLAVDGELFERTTGFRYVNETLPPNWIEQIVDSYARLGWWP